MSGLDELRKQSSWWEPHSPTTPRVEGSAGRCCMPDPSRKRPPTNPAPEPSPLGNLIRTGRLRWFRRCPWRPWACHGIQPVLGSTRTGQTARPGTRKGRPMTEAAGELRRQPHRQPRGPLHRRRVARAMFRVAVSGRRSRSRRSSPWSCGATRPSTRPSRSRRAAGSSSWASSSSGTWTAEDGSACSVVEVVAELGRACGRQRRPGPRRARTASQLDQRCDGAGRG